MFKYLSRVRASLYERGILSNRTPAPGDQGGSNAVTQENKIKSQLPCSLRLVPCFLEACQRHLSQLNIQQNFEQRSDSSGNKSSGQSSTGDSFHSENINYHQPCAIIGAVGWSGVLVLGWTILQPWYRHERRKPLIEPDVKSDNVKHYAGLCKLLLHPALSQPFNHILPEPVEKKDNQVQSSSSASSTTEPKTKVLSPEEAFDEAAEEVRLVHERVVGEAENRRGIACLSHKRNREAVEHFRVASTFKNAPAAFNLGQCYELGIGTDQDFTQAAHWYKVASDMGHSTAMYNLGVFHAHGWGGLKSDSRKAKQLFLTAAALGQREAQAALNISERSNATANNETNSNDNKTESFESRLALDFFKMNNIGVKFLSPNQKRDDYKDLKENVSRFRPESSLPSSSSPSSTMSSLPSSSSSVSSTNEHPLMFNQRISTIDESSENYTETSSEDEWHAAADIASMNGNSTTLYRLAVCYENSPTVDPELILQLYRMAADHGHHRAKQRLKILEDHYALGTLDSYLRSIKKKSKYSSVADCSLHE